MQSRATVSLRPRFFESLEARTLLSTGYSYLYETVAKTGQNASGALTGFGTGPSINDAGTVAFVGKHAAGDALFIGAGTAASLKELSAQFDNDSSRTFGQAVQINSQGQVVAQELVIGSNRKRFIQIWPQTSPNTFSTVATANSAGFGNFAAVFPFPTINDSGQTAFGVLSQSNQQQLADPAGSSFHTLAIAGVLSPEIDNKGEIVVRAGSATTSPIVLYSNALTPLQTIASSTDFAALGQTPGISHDGHLVAFYGVLTPQGAADLNAKQKGWAPLRNGAGIFVSIQTSAGAFIQRVAGYGGNGVLDPGETYVDANHNGQFDPGEKDVGPFTSFSADTRIAVNDTAVDQAGAGVAFLALGSDGKQGLYASRLQLIYKDGLISQPTSETGAIAPTSSRVLYHSLVMKQGQVIAGLAGKVQTIGINDPINGYKSGQLAFYVSTDANAQAIIRATPMGVASIPLTSTSPVNLTQRTGNQSEGSIAIDPRNTNHIFMAGNIDPRVHGLAAASSQDGGKTWTRGLIATDASTTITPANGDPHVAWDTFGNLFLTYISADLKHIELVRSIDNGLTFGNPVELATVHPGKGDVDQPSVAVGAGSVWVTYTLTGVVAARGAKVTGLGQVGAFGATELVSGVQGSFGDIAVGPTGQMMVTYEADLNNQLGPSRLFVAVDPDGLGPKGFSAPVLATNTQVGNSDPLAAMSPTNLDHNIDVEVNLAWDRSNGPHKGRVYMVYTNEAGPDALGNTDIFVRHSDDNGSTWSDPVQVNDDGTDLSQLLPAIAVDQTTGNLAVSWFDARNDTSGPGDISTDNLSNNEVQYFAAVSTDGGVTFSPNVLLSRGAIKARAAQNNNGIGDYTGLAFQGGSLWGVWADNSAALGGNPDRPHLDIAAGHIQVPTGFSV